MYGMVQPGVASTVAVRAVYFIDPKRVIRLILYYPLNVGRNMDEILRALKALQLTDKAPVATPLDWQPGCEVVEHAPETMEGVDAKLAAKKPGMVDFYLVKTKVDE